MQVREESGENWESDYVQFGCVDPYKESVLHNVEDTMKAIRDPIQLIWNLIYLFLGEDYDSNCRFSMI